MTRTLLIHSGLAPFSEAMGMETLTATPELFEMRLAVRDWLTNRKGDLHGGATAALIDTSAGLAAIQGLPEGTASSTVSMTINYLAPGRGSLRSLARCTRRGRSLTFVEVEVFDAGDALIATASLVMKLFLPR